MPLDVNETTQPPTPPPARRPQPACEGYEPIGDLDYTDDREEQPTPSPTSNP